jgi:branched-chain amino acid transport system substrate-binding protein
VTAANRLVFEDQVKYIIGPVGSAPLLAVQPVTERNKVIVLTLGFTPKALGKDKPFTFRPCLTTGEFSQPQTDWVVKAKGAKKVGGLFPNDETGQQIARDVDVAYRKTGAQLASKEFFERDRVDFVPLLTRVLGGGIDAIELDGNSPATAGLLVKQARELGFGGLIVRTGGPATAEILNVAGKQAAEGLYVHSALDPTLPSVAKYIERYTRTYKQSMNGFSPYFYDGAHMLFQAMRKAGTITDTDKVRRALEGIGSYDGVLGKLHWTGKEKYGIDHQISAPFFVAQVKDGAEVIVARCSLSGCN